MLGENGDGIQNSIETSDRGLNNFMVETYEHGQKRRREEKKDRKELVQENKMYFSH